MKPILCLQGKLKTLFPETSSVTAKTITHRKTLILNKKVASLLLIEDKIVD